MAKIVFKRTSNQINVNTSSNDVENVNVQKDRKVSVNKTAEDQLDNVQIQQEEQLRVTFGPPTSGPVYIVELSRSTGTNWTERKLFLQQHSTR